MLSTADILERLLPFLPNEQCCQKKRLKGEKRSALIWQVHKYKTTNRIDFNLIPFIDKNALLQLLKEERATDLKHGNYKCIKSFKSSHGKPWKINEVAGSKWLQSMTDAEMKNFEYLNDNIELSPRLLTTFA